MIAMQRKEFDILCKTGKLKLPGYIFSFLGVDFGCSNMQYCNGKLEKANDWYLYDLDTGRKCAKAVNRRALSESITPRFVKELNAKKAELYKIENRC